MVLAGFWVFVAVGSHGLVDMGITYKAAARLLYLMLGIAVSAAFICEKEKKNPFF